MVMEDFPPRDEWGMTEEDWRWMRFETEQENRRNRWRAFRALWFKPVVNDARTNRRTDGVVCYQDARDADWTLWRAIKMTIALLLDRHWSDEVERRHLARTGKRYEFGVDMVFWDSADTYGGYEVMMGRLYPGLRVSLFSDGECLM